MNARKMIRIISLATLAACGGHTAPPASVVPPLPPYASDAEIRDAAALITPAKVLQRIAVIADDSVAGRNTPSAGLEMTARYLADNYQRMGLKPAGDSGSWIQRYGILRVRAAPTTSYVEFAQGGAVDRFTLERWGTASGPMTGQRLTAGTKIISGKVTAPDIEPLTLEGFIVIFVQNPARTTDNTQVSRVILQKHPLAIINVVSTNAAEFATRVQSALIEGNPRPIVDGVPLTGPLTITVHDTLFNDYANRPDFAAMRNASAPVLMNVPAAINVSVQATQEIISRATAPNVVAMVEGNDSTLKHEYVIFSGHMDHVGTAGDGVGGCTAKGNDKICNGADDDASGTTGLLSIAEAIAQLKGRTHRTLVILNVSGEEKGLLGSSYFTTHPTLPLAQVVADINMDMIGRNNTDSIVVIGKEHSDMGTTLAGVQAQHPELHLTAADDIWPQESFYTRSDHFNFAKMGVPVLFFFNGVHPQYHQPDDEVGLIDTSKLARVSQLAFYLGVTIANTTERPKWNPQSYQTIVVEQKVPAVKP